MQKRLEGSPMSPRMTILYRFWTHFLQEHFNRKVYEEFKALAIEDTQITTGKSVEYLLEFFGAVCTTLEAPRPEFIRDFVDLVEKEVSRTARETLSSVLNSSITKASVKAGLDLMISADLRRAL